MGEERQDTLGTLMWHHSEQVSHWRDLSEELTVLRHTPHFESFWLSGVEQRSSSELEEAW